MNIRQKLLIILLTIGLVPMVLVSTVVAVNVTNELNFRTLDQLTSLAIKQEQQVNAYLQENQEEVIRLAINYDIHNALIQAQATGGAKGVEILTSILRAKKAELAHMRAGFVTDVNGKVIASTLVGQPPERLVVNGAKIGQSTIAIQEDPVDKFNKLYISSPVTVSSSETALVIGVFAIDDLTAAIHDYTGLGNSGETVVAYQDESGNSISMFALRFDAEGALATKLNDMHLFPSREATTTDGRDYRGQKVISAMRTVDATGWAMATKLDQSEAHAPINDLRNTLLVIALLSTLGIIVIAFYFASRFTAPIMQLIATTRKVMRGDLSQKIPVRTSDEIGSLASTFNAMTAQLASLYRGLQQKVADRTKALNSKVQELEGAKAKDDALFSGIGEGIIALDPRGVVIRVNQPTLDILGVTEKDIMGETLVDIIPFKTADGQKVQPAMLPGVLPLRSGQKMQQQFEIMRPDKSKRQIDIISSPILFQLHIIGAIMVVRDITKEREVDRMKTEFISLASHQLRTPLSAIRWFSEMLLSGDAGELNPDQADFAKNISDSTERMIELVNSLLNISRIESGRIIVDPRPTDLRELVSGIVNDLKAKTEEKQQTLVISVHKEMPKVNLDPRLIGQVYLNLLTNAIKYTPKGGEISVFVSRKGDQVVSQVTDNGFGIPLSEQGKVFQKFFRAENIVKFETDGTGLGLYLIKAIVESSGGRIWFKSEEGKGTTFWFSLPASGMQAKAGEVTLDA